MATHISEHLPDDSTSGGTRATARGGYFFGMSVILLAFVLTGFAPTLYLRAFFPQYEPSMPAYLYLHGGVLTGWFVWLVLQTWLVRSRRTSIHRRMGWIGAAIAAGVCVVGPLATFGVVGRLRSFGIEFDTDMSALPFLGVEGVTMLEFAAPVIWGNLMSIAVFAGLVGAAVLLRKRTDYHKRLMLIASIGLVPPALARISRWPVFGGEDGLFLPLVGLALLLSVPAYDLLTRRKTHPATLAGVALIIGVLIGSNAIAQTEFGQAYVRSLG